MGSGQVNGMSRDEDSTVPEERVLRCLTCVSSFWNHLATVNSTEVSVEDSGEAASDLFHGTARYKSYGPPVNMVCQPRLTDLRWSKAGYFFAS